jgi:tetratricopeptide (TPR) repeat protein
MLRRQICLLPTKSISILLMMSALCTPIAAHAEPVKNRILSGYQVHVERKCTIFKINFNHRVRYVSHFPISSGTELRIMLHAIDPRQFDLDGGNSREALRPPTDRSVAINAIQYEAAIAEAPTLTIIFARPFNFDAAGGADFQSLVFSVTDKKDGKACKPIFPAQATNAWQTVIDGPQTPSERVVPKQTPKRVVLPVVPVTPDAPTVAAPLSVGDRSPANGSAPVSGPTMVAATGAKTDTGSNSSEGATAALITQARSALQQGKFQLAIAQLKKAIQLAENRRSPEARELLGVAYQKDQQLPAAKAVYEDYLARYPNSEGSEGVRQRLAAMETANAPSVKALRAPTIGPTAIGGGAQGYGNGQPSGSQNWSVSGSLSSFYIRDDTHSVMRDPTLALNLNAAKDDHQVHQNTLLSSFDLFAAYNDANIKSRFRLSGTEQNRFGSDQPDITGIGALYLDTTVKDWDTTFSIGRQTRNTNGVLGRFDGVVVSYQVTPLFGVTALAGSPVEFRSDSPFKDDRFFYGGSVNFNRYFGLDASVYAIEQMDRSIIDRQAVGTELRYNDPVKSAFLTVDYDTHFNELDAAIFTGTWTLPDKSVLRAGADYRKAPYLTTWNALQGQPYGTLYDLLKAYTQSDLQQMAMDRTATYQSSTLGYSRPLTDNLQLNLDFTQAHIDGTIASYNVNGTPDMGDEFYYSAQLVGTSLFTPNDLYTAAFRYSDLKDSHNYAVDLSTRYNVSETFRIQPRFVGGETEGKTTPYREYTVLPSLLLTYAWTKDLNFELEVGERWTWRTQGTTTTSESEFLITAGIRLDFYADAQNCLIPSVFCRLSSQAAK